MFAVWPGASVITFVMHFWSLYEECIDKFFVNIIKSIYNNPATVSVTSTEIGVLVIQ